MLSALVLDKPSSEASKLTDPERELYQLAYRTRSLPAHA